MNRKEYIKKRCIYLASSILLLMLAIIFQLMEVRILSNPAFFNHWSKILLILFRIGMIVSVVGSVVGVQKFLKIGEKNN